jgi:ribosomal protein S25
MTKNCGKMNEIKKLALIIALKRRNSSSAFRKKSNHVIARELGISAYLFSRIVKELSKDGVIIEKNDNYYHIIKFKEVVTEFYHKSNIRLGYYEILKGESINYHEVLKELYDFFIDSNIYKPQEFLINKKQELLSSSSRTVLKAKSFFVKKMYDTRCVDEITDSIQEEIRVSCRLIAKKFNISQDKANKLLKQSEKFVRKEVIRWENNIMEGKLEYLKSLHKKVHIIEFPNYNKYKLHFGSTLSYANTILLNT